MRVITGKYKGRALIAPKTDARPTLDRTKETLFNILNFQIPQSVVLDLFAGSGQLAIECLSRGASRAILCDVSKDAAQAVKANFQKIGETPELFVCDYSACLSRLANAGVDIVFVDPPYKSGYYLDVLEKLDRYNVVDSNGVVVCEHACDDSLPQEAHGFAVCDERKIGSVVFTFFRRLK